MLNQDTQESIGSPTLEKSSVNLTTYNGENISLLGTCHLTAMYKNSTRNVPVIALCSRTSPNIFGMDAFYLSGLYIRNNVHAIDTQVSHAAIQSICDRYERLFDGTPGRAKISQPTKNSRRMHSLYLAAHTLCNNVETAHHPESTSF